MAALGGLSEFRAHDGLKRWESVTEWPMTIAALLFVVVLLAPLAFTLNRVEDVIVRTANFIIWLVFAIDYFIRLYLAPARWKFIKTHILDLLVVIVPFLRPIRLLRLIKLFALVGVFTRRAQRGLHGRAMVFILTIALVVMVSGALVVLDVERKSPTRTIKNFPDAIWWAMSTVTTVGYGDKYPTTGMGRAVAILLMLTGIALVGTLTAAIATWFVSELNKADREVAEAAEKQASEERERMLVALREQQEQGQLERAHILAELDEIKRLVLRNQVVHQVE